LDRLIYELGRQRCLLILDKEESLTTAGENAGSFRPGYEAYDQLFQRLGESVHQSCLLLTSREQPREFPLLQAGLRSVQTLWLGGLTVAAGQRLLHGLGVADTPALPELVQRYSGNPLALKLVAVTIQEVFAGNVASFLAQDTFVFDNIRNLLDQHFARLSATERDLLYWLAIEREPIPFAALYDNLVQPTSRQEVLESVRSLQRRSLLEQVGDRFYLSNVITEYLADRLVAAIKQELVDLGVSGDDSLWRPDAQAQLEASPVQILHTHLNRYALVKAQAKEYVCESQQLLLLQPVVEAFTRQWSKETIALRLQQLLHRLRSEAARAPGYAAANLLHLLLQLQVDLRGYDFSQLSVWQAYLRGISLPGVNFSRADLTDSVFTEPLGYILALAFSPDGKWLAASCTGNQIYLWHTANQQVWRVLSGDRVVGHGLAFSPDGDLLANGDLTGMIRLWHLSETNEHLEPAQVLQAHDGEVKKIAFSPYPTSSYLMASASYDQTVQVWEIDRASAIAADPALHIQRRHSLPHPQRVAALAFSPDGRILVTGGADHLVRLWDIASGQLRHVWSGHTGEVRSLAFSPDGRWLASASFDQTVRVWEVATGQVQHVLDNHDWIVGTVAFSPDSKTIATGSHDQMVRLWDAQTGQLIHTLTGHTYVVWSVTFHPDGQLLASGSADQTVRLWDAQTGQPLYTLHGHPRALRAIALSMDQTLASAGHDQLVHLWQLDGVVSERSHRTLHGHTGRLYALAFTSDSRLLASAGADRTLRLWDGQSGQLQATLHGHTDAIYTLAFSPDNQRVASGGRDHLIRLHDVASGQLQATLRGHTGEINSLAFHPQGSLLASISEDQTLRLWDLTQGDAPAQAFICIDLVEYGALDGTAVAFSPDGQYVACGSTHLLFVWKWTGAGKLDLHHRLKAHKSWITAVAFHPDGAILASSGYDITICLWDVHSGQLLHQLKRQDGIAPTAIVFSADGAHLFSAGDDGSITCWEVATGKCLQILSIESPYAGMNITGVTGLTEAQQAGLIALGAVRLTDRSLQPR
jgi:WD40 repeat protein